MPLKLVPLLRLPFVPISARSAPYPSAAPTMRFWLRRRSAPDVSPAVENRLDVGCPAAFMEPNSAEPLLQNAMRGAHQASLLQPGTAGERRATCAAGEFCSMNMSSVAGLSGMPSG